MCLDEARAEGRIAIGEELGELFTTSGEERHFESGNPVETPGGVGHGLDKSGFATSDRLKIVEEIGDAPAGSALVAIRRARPDFGFGRFECV